MISPPKDTPGALDALSESDQASVKAAITIVGMGCDLMPFVSRRLLEVIHTLCEMVEQAKEENPGGARQRMRFCKMNEDLRERLRVSEAKTLDRVEAKLQAVADKYHAGSGPWSRAMDVLGGFRKVREVLAEDDRAEGASK